VHAHFYVVAESTLDRAPLHVPNAMLYGSITRSDTQMTAVGGRGTAVGSLDTDACFFSGVTSAAVILCQGPAS